MEWARIRLLLLYRVRTVSAPLCGKSSSLLRLLFLTAKISLTSKSLTYPLISIEMVGK
jgi:hypothetical protein